MSILDSIVLFGYFVLITAFGIWISRRMRTSDRYFRGERKFKWWIMVGQAFGVGTHAEMPVAQAGATFSNGFATIWYQWKNMLITPFYWLLAPFYRRSERTTVGEIIEDRYGSGLGTVYTLFAISFFVSNMGVMMQGAAKVIAVASGNLISPNTVVFFMTITFLLYSFIGGLVATNMSTCSNFMVNTGALFTKNLYKRYLNPSADDRRVLWMGRYSGLALSVLAVLFSFSTYYLLNFLSTGKIRLVYTWKPGPFGLAMLAGFLSFCLVSLLTRPEDKEKMEAFFDNMRRKSDAAEVDEAGKKPLAANSGDDLLLLDLPGWKHKERWTHSFHRYREDLAGFFISWIFVGALILLAWAILKTR